MTTNQYLRYTQNFLHSHALVEKIIEMAKISAGSTVLEIGPGDGIITGELAKKVTTEGRVIAIEFDKTLTNQLHQKYKDTVQVEIIHMDILKYRFDKLTDYTVFSNIPFNITSELLERLFDVIAGPTSAHLILQTDTLVGTNRSGLPTETFKSMMIQPIYNIEIEHRFSRTDFRPQPGVDTALFSFHKRDTPLIASERYASYKDFLAFVSKDRVGEGVWKRIFSKNQLIRLTDSTELSYGQGLKSQNIQGVVAAFNLFIAANTSKHVIIENALARLRAEQTRREQINRQGNHHRSNKRQNKNPRK